MNFRIKRYLTDIRKVAGQKKYNKNLEVTLEILDYKVLQFSEKFAFSMAVSSKKCVWFFDS